ncbi:hypothetical protein D018_4207B, partial [Vibrio parahaemolyticus VP2007-007]
RVPSPFASSISCFMMSSLV